MGKDFSLANLVRDLDYAVNGTFVHQALFHICPPRAGLTVLEPGCGSGKFGLSYALRGCAKVTMFDIDPSVVDYARRLMAALEALRAGPVPAEINTGDIFKMPYDTGLFDLVMNEGIPQHWPDEERRQMCINEMARVSRSIVAIIGNNGVNPREQEIDRTFQFGYVGMPQTRKCFTPEELLERMKRAGLFDLKAQALDGNWENARLFMAWGVKKT